MEAWQMDREADSIMEEINSDPDLANVTVPPDLQEKLWEQIHAYEEAKAVVEEEMYSEEHQELLRLGRLYQKRRRQYKYVFLAAVLVFTMACGITSMGGAEKIFRMLERNVLNREQIQVNSGENVEQNNDLSEEQVYEEIEAKFGFYPVRLNYLPSGIVLIESEIDEIIPRIYMSYGKNHDVKISYIIRPNYKEGSWGKDIEDELLEEFEIELENAVVSVRKYLIENETIRWHIGFEYHGTHYSIYVHDAERTEVEKVVQNLYFF